ncbi:MAG TPA: acetate/propionate family kinase [Polyangiales bacterium]|jgi:acetate kinase
MASKEMVVLSINVGSSSLKFALFALAGTREERLAAGSIDRIGQANSQLSLRLSDGPDQKHDVAFADQEAAIVGAFDTLQAQRLPPPEAVGHRLVHGGPDHFDPVRVDAALLEALRDAVQYAPLHLPSALRAIEVVSARFPALEQVACFDTAFHAGMPEIARRLPLPRAIHERGVHRYGFHGLSYEYVVSKLGAASLGRAVLAHLGSGASLAAVSGGRSIDTSMGLTPTGGIMMGTRTGDLDPGVIIHLLDAGSDARALERTLDHESGLLGVSETSADVRTLLEKRAGDERAALAIDMFTYQVRKTVGAYAAALGGIDNLVFTGGIGEHAPQIRAEVCAPLAHLGIQLDPQLNDQNAELISTRQGACKVRVVETDEELMIARHTARLSAG